MDNWLNYGLIFFDPELRRGLVHNAELAVSRAEVSRVGSRPRPWFVNALRLALIALVRTVRLRKVRQELSGI